MSGMQGNKDIEGEELEALKGSSRMFGDVNYKAAGSKYVLLGIEPLEGKDAYKIEETSKEGKKETSWYDVNSNFLVKTMSVSEAPAEMGGGTMTAVSLYYDYKAIDGIQYAHKINQSAGPQVFDMIVKSIEHNTKLGDEIFE
jgi:hypothetical protein